MKLCASYHCKNEQVNEIRYPVSMLTTVFQEIVEHPEKSYIIEVLSIQEQNFPVEKLLALMQEQDNLVIDCYKREDYIALYEIKMPHIMYHYPVATYNDLWWLLQTHPYGISITEPLAFDLPNVRQIINEHSSENEHIQIRVVPTIGRPTSWNIWQLKDQGLRHFWITPQTTHIYEPYVDVYDLYDADIMRESTLVQMYADGECKWDMTVLLKNCGIALPAFMIDDEFATRRLTCKQRCMQHEYSCHRCDIESKAMAHIIASQSKS